MSTAVANNGRLRALERDFRKARDARLHAWMQTLSKDERREAVRYLRACPDVELRILMNQVFQDGRATIPQQKKIGDGKNEEK